MQTLNGSGAGLLGNAITPRDDNGENAFQSPGKGDQQQPLLLPHGINISYLAGSIFKDE